MFVKLTSNQPSACCFAQARAMKWWSSLSVAAYPRGRFVLRESILPAQLGDWWPCNKSGVRWRHPAGWHGGPGDLGVADAGTDSHPRAVHLHSARYGLPGLRRCRPAPLSDGVDITDLRTTLAYGRGFSLASR